MYKRLCMEVIRDDSFIFLIKPILFLQKKSIIDILQGPKYGTYGCFCESVCKQEIIYSLSSDVYLVISMLIQKRHRPTWQHELQTNQKVV